MLPPKCFVSIMGMRLMYGVQALSFTSYWVVFHHSGQVHEYKSGPGFFCYELFLILSLRLFSLHFASQTETDSGIFRQILYGKLDFNSEPWPNISDSAKDLIRKMLTRDPKERISAHEVLCGWFLTLPVGKILFHFVKTTSFRIIASILSNMIRILFGDKVIHGL